jgi:hypothetical protein
MTRRYISPSEIASMDCWRSYNWKRAGLRPRRSPRALSFGSAWDAFMGEWFRPIGTLKDVGNGARDERTITQRLYDSLTAGQEVLDKAKEQANAATMALVGEGLAEVEHEYQEHADMLRGMGEHFAEWFDEDVHGTCRAAQFRVDVPLRSEKGTRASTRYSLHGYIDRVMEVNGKLVIVDDKTTAGIDDSFHDDFENDLQMPLYAYGMKLMGYDIGGIAVFAAAKKVPVMPELRKTLVSVLGDDGEPLTRPVLDEDGEPVRFKSGARAGEVKTEKVMKPALRSMLSESGALNYTTNQTNMLEAIIAHELDVTDYARELEWLREKGSSNFFALAPVPVSKDMIEEAAHILRSAGPMLDKIPDVPMRSRFRCKRCQFQTACVERHPESRADLLKTFYTTREERRAEADRVAARQQTQETPA